MNIGSIAVMLGVAIANAGCASSIHVARLAPGQSATGVPWNLAMTRYTVTITRQLRHCDNDLTGTIAVSAVAGKKIDDDQRYVLSASGMRATADITSTLAADGTSTGLNAHSEDQTAAIITNSVGVLAALATAGAAAAGPLRFECSPAVNKALATLYPANGAPSLKDIVDQETRVVAQATERVTQLTLLSDAQDGTVAPVATSDAASAHSAGGKPDARASKKKAPSRNNNSLLRAAIVDLLDKKNQLNADQAKLSAALNVVTAKQTVMWPAAASVTATSAGAAFSLDQETAKAWVHWKDNGEGTVPTKHFDVHLALYRSDGAGGWRQPAGLPPSGDVAVGVPVRLPRPGRLLACSPEPCAPALAADWVADDTHTVPTEDGPVLQFGDLYTVPVTGGLFKSEGAVIALDANGVPTSIEVSEKAAVAAAATGAAQSAASALAALPGQISAARLARTEAATKQVKADIALDEARAGSSTAGSTAAAGAQTAYLDASAALATAKANASAAGQLGDLAAQQAITTQQVAVANEEAALATAKANAAVAPALNVMSANTSLINAQAAQINAQVALAQAQATLTQ